MSWITIIVDPNDNKVKIDWFYLKKIVIGTVRGDQFLYIILEVDNKYILIATIFLSQFSDSFSHGFLPILYYSPPFISTIHV